MKANDKEPFFCRFPVNPNFDFFCLVEELIYPCWQSKSKGFFWRSCKLYKYVLEVQIFSSLRLRDLLMAPSAQYRVCSSNRQRKPTERKTEIVPQKRGEDEREKNPARSFCNFSQQAALRLVNSFSFSPSLTILLSRALALIDRGRCEKMLRFWYFFYPAKVTGYGEHR